MNDNSLPLPPELQHLLEKRIQQDRRIGERRSGKARAAGLKERRANRERRRGRRRLGDG